MYYAVTHKTNFYYVLWSQIRHFSPPVVKPVPHIFMHIVSRWIHSLVISNLGFDDFKFQIEHKMCETKLLSAFRTLNCTKQQLTKHLVYKEHVSWSGFKVICLWY